jgi:hypothetical protein
MAGLLRLVSECSNRSRSNPTPQSTSGRQKETAPRGGQFLGYYREERYGAACLDLGKIASPSEIGTAMDRY